MGESKKRPGAWRGQFEYLSKPSHGHPESKRKQQNRIKHPNGQSKCWSAITRALLFEYLTNAISCLDLELTWPTVVRGALQQTENLFNQLRLLSNPTMITWSRPQIISNSTHHVLFLCHRGVNPGTLRSSMMNA